MHASSVPPRHLGDIPSMAVEHSEQDDPTENTPIWLGSVQLSDRVPATNLQQVKEQLEL